jgi:hypothetical protein
MSTLHILNGDSTLHGFKQTSLSGDDTMVWREVLSEGPLEQDIASAHFWQVRSEWICKTFDDETQSYREGMIEPLSILSQPHDEINLWFEFDLHCQSNLLGVMNYLKQQTDLSGPAIYLICPGSFPNKPDFAGMGELNGEELEYLYDNIRLQLSEIDFIVAAEAWSLYVNHDAQTLKKYLDETTFWGSLHFLKAALTAHLARLQYNAAGLNYIEQKLLDIYKDGHTELCDICVIFWQTEKIYGMGDLEIKSYLDGLKEKGLVK